MKRTKVILAVATLTLAGLALPASASAAASTRPAFIPSAREMRGMAPMGHVAHSSCGEMRPDLV